MLVYTLETQILPIQLQYQLQRMAIRSAYTLTVYNQKYLKVLPVERWQKTYVENTSIICYLNIFTIDKF